MIASALPAVLIHLPSNCTPELRLEAEEKNKEKKKLMGIKSAVDILTGKMPKSKTLRSLETISRVCNNCIAGTCTHHYFGRTCCGCFDESVMCT